MRRNSISPPNVCWERKLRETKATIIYNNTEGSQCKHKTMQQEHRRITREAPISPLFSLRHYVHSTFNQEYSERLGARS